MNAGPTGWISSFATEVTENAEECPDILMLSVLSVAENRV